MLPAKTILRSRTTSTRPQDEAHSTAKWFVPENMATTMTLHSSCCNKHQQRTALQELLDHPFLRPAEGPAGPAPGQVGLTRDQLKKLLTQVIQDHSLSKPHTLYVPVRM